MMRKIDGLSSLSTGLALGLSALFGFAPAAFAGTGQPSPWQFDFQTPVTPIMETIHDFHLFVTIISALITSGSGVS